MTDLTTIATAHDLTPAELEAQVIDLADRMRTAKAVRGVLTELAAATEERAAAERRWRELIVEASATGASRTAVASAAGISRQWVIQMARTAAQR